MKYICIILLASVIALASYGQNEIPAATLKIVPNGKPGQMPYESYIDKAVADQSGNVWFGTSQGVYRYDGKAFTNYTTMDGLSLKNLSCILADKNGNVWFGAERGVCRFDGKSFKTLPVAGIKNNRQYSLNLIPALNAQPVYEEQLISLARVFEDRHGLIWVFSDCDVYRYDTRSGTLVATGLGNFIKTTIWTNERTRQENSIADMYEDKKGNFWFTSENCGAQRETYRLDATGVSHPCVAGNCRHNINNAADLAAHNQEISASFKRVTVKDESRSIVFSSVLEDKTGKMWFSTWSNGMYLFDGKNFIPIFTGDGLASSSVLSVIEDKSGCIWFNTRSRNSDALGGNGVYRYDPTAAHTAAFSPAALTHFTKKDGLLGSSSMNNNGVTCAFADDAGNIWFGGQGGFCRYNGPSSRKHGVPIFTSFTKKDGFGEQPVECIVKDNKGNIWIGTWQLGLYRFDGKSITCFTEKKA